MTTLRRQVARAQRRLWLNRWFLGLGWSGVAAGGAFTLLVLVVRLFSLPWSLGWWGLVLAGGAVAVSLAWAARTREDAVMAAVVLDRNAGLKERLSTGLHVETGTDPFERAVHRDAERISATLAVRRHVPLRWPDSGGYALATASLAALMFWFLPTYDLLGREREQAEQRQQAERIERTRENVTRVVGRLKQLARTNAALKEAAAAAELDKLTAAPASQPVELQRTAVKKLGALADRLREKRESGRFDALTQMKRMLRQLRDPRLRQTPVGRLQQALARGDFRKAAAALKATSSELKKAEQAGNAEQVRQLRKQLDALAKKLNQLARVEKLAKDLKQAGLNEAQVRRVLEQLAKMDLDQLRKQLEREGLDKETVEKLAKKLAQNRAAGKACRRLGRGLRKMAQAGSGGVAGPSGAAAEGLTEAAEQLSELEMLQQQMGEMEAALNEVRNAMNNLGQRTGGRSAAPGTARTGRGIGKGLRPEETAAFALEKRKAKLRTGRGQVIGKVYFDGAQIKGEAAAAYIEAVRAAHDEATEALADDRIPRQFHAPVRAYFRQMVADLPEASPADRTKQE